MKEFEQERGALAFQLTSIPGIQVNAAEQWGAISAPVEKIYTGGVQRCHIYIGLFGKVYSAATQEEYEEACRNPYRQKLIYLRQSKNIDFKLQELIKVFQQRHKPYTFRNLWDLQPRVAADLDFS